MAPTPRNRFTASIVLGMFVYTLVVRQTGRYRIDVELTGFDEDELQALLDSVEEIEEIPPPDPPETPASRTGDPRS